MSLRIHRRKIDLRICVTQFGEAPNFAERRRFGLCWKFFNPTEGLLGDIQSLCRRLFEPPGGFGWILGNAAAPLIHQAEFKLSFCVTLLSGFAELSEGGLIIAHQQGPRSSLVVRPSGCAEGNTQDGEEDGTFHGCPPQRQ